MCQDDICQTLPEGPYKLILVCKLPNGAKTLLLKRNSASYYEFITIEKKNYECFVSLINKKIKAFSLIKKCITVKHEKLIICKVEMHLPTKSLGIDYEFFDFISGINTKGRLDKYMSNETYKILHDISS